MRGPVSLGDVATGAVKRIKDPVYGYIELPRSLFDSVVDTAEFQRLRRVVQTSYAPLYPSALHNRFVHSLGVYHLGSMAAAALVRSATGRYGEKAPQGWQDSLETFRLACLLHDVGHAPFSHTGENFYREKGHRPSIDDELKEVVGNPRFSRDASAAAKEAAPHEVMSALVGLERYASVIPDRALFARCITGYKHAHPRGEREYLENVLIELLNSSTIDVDKLDYLIRDAYVIGFDSIVIDYVRLLRGIRLTGREGHPVLAFHKSALSVLENVVYARDLEKEWVQSHPVILYEQYLIQRMAAVVNAALRSDGDLGVFCKQALTVSGIRLASGQTLRLVSDDDIIYLAKQMQEPDESITEYFDRGKRRHPIWKSEAEFRALFCLEAAEIQEAIDALSAALGGLSEYLDAKGLGRAINVKTLATIESEMRALEEQDAKSLLAKERDEGRDLQDQHHLLRALHDFSERKEIEFDYVLLDQKSFKSGFESGDLGSLKVVFSDRSGEPSYLLKGLLPSTRLAGESQRVFYLFHHDASQGDFPKKELVDCLKSVFA